MLSDFRPFGLDDLAKRVGVDPLEAVRLLVVAGATTDDQLYTPAHVEKIVQAGQIETWWKEVSSDTNPARGHVCGALQILIDRGCVGDKGARIDNLWRGLEPEDAEPVREAVDLLVGEGMLLLSHTPAGPMIAIASRAQSDISRIAQGSFEPAALAAVWKR